MWPPVDSFRPFNPLERETMKTENHGDSQPYQNGKFSPPVPSAANDPNFSVPAEMPLSLRELTAVAQACRQVLDAPKDLPTSQMAMPGLAVAFRILQKRRPGAGLIAQRIEAATETATMSGGSGATILALSRRVGRYLMYSTAINIGTALKTGKPLDETALSIYGAWAARRLFDDYFPSNTAMAKVSAALLQPNSSLALSWTDKARNRAHSLALRNLDDAIKKHEVAASGYGLASTNLRIAQSNLPVDVFNRKFRSRVESLIDFATHDAISAAGGYDTLRAAGLLESGRALMEGVKTGDKGDLLVCIEIISHLTSEMALLIPFQTGDEPPVGALAWLDIPGGAYYQTLFQLIERCARPDEGTEHLYEKTTQIVRIWLSPPIHQFLIAEMDANGWVATNPYELLGDVGHHPNSAVVGDSAYRCTSRRIQESVPTLLLIQGHHRWPTATGTNSHFLVTRGRPAYGACEVHAIDEIVDAAYQLLGWPQAARESGPGLVGSFTTPKPESVTTALNYLVDKVDATSREPHDLEELIRFLNHYAQWLAMLLALAYALRRWLRYALPGVELRTGADMHFDDKDVHLHKGPPVPTSNFVKCALNGWFELCTNTASQMRQLGDCRSLDLSARIEARMNDVASLEAVFTIDAADRLEPVGHHTWWDTLPANIRLRPNFARQFWPLQLMNMGVEQLLIDILMRHQLDGMHPGSSHSVKKIRDATERLRVCLDSVLGSLSLRLPKSIGGH